MANEIRTDRVDEQSRITPRGDIVPVFRVTFFVGDNGPFFVEFAKAEFTTENVKRAQEEIAATVRGL